tara:strand:- start:182 stop:547 length:366 start_codon:yes stop_codon:yes gene_type:complete
MSQATKQNSRLQHDMRDLLGFIRVENAVLMDQGNLSLRGMYLQKMMMLKDLEDQAESLADHNSDEDILECLMLLKNIHKELKVNTVHHIEALKNKTSTNDISNRDDLFDDEDGHQYTGGWA